jgi:hypothetical protein
MQASPLPPNGPRGNVIRVEGMAQSAQIGDETEANQRQIMRREMKI